MNLSRCHTVLCLSSADNILIGWFARDPSTLRHVGHVLLQLNPLETRKTRRLVIADDLFQLSKVPKWKTVDVVKKVAEKLSGCMLHLFFHMNVVLPCED